MTKPTIKGRKRPPAPARAKPAGDLAGLRLQAEQKAMLAASRVHLEQKPN